MEKLTDMQGIGPKCDSLLRQVGISSPDQLRQLGAMEAYCRIIEETHFKPHIGLLFALVGAVENHSWQDVAQKDKARLRAELEGLKEIKSTTKL